MKVWRSIFFIHCICILIFSGSLVSCFEGELEVQSPLLDVGGDDEDGDNGDGDEGDGLPVDIGDGEDGDGLPVDNGDGEDGDDSNVEPSGDFIRGRRVENCLDISLSDSNACIFGKNPVADVGESLNVLPLVNAGAVLASEFEEELIGLVDVSSLQDYAVSIPGDRLETEDFLIDYSVFVTPPVDPSDVARNSDGTWKYTFNEEPNFNLLNTHVFFWLNYLAQSIKNVTGTFYGEGKEIKVVPLYFFHNSGDEISLYRNAAWTGTDFNLMLFGLSDSMGVDENGESVHIPLAFDSGIAAHEAGHAILDYASPNLIRLNDDLEEICGSNGYCAIDLKGGPLSIHEGVGDVVVLFLFPNSTSIGELFVNSPEGLNHCGVTRDVRQIQSQGLDAQDLFDACSSYGYPGEIHAMGSIYARIWYGVFKRALQRGGNDERNLAYQLFFQHLLNITNQDDFETLRETIKAIDDNLFEGKFSEDLDLEYGELNYEV